MQDPQDEDKEIKEFIPLWVRLGGAILIIAAVFFELQLWFER